MAVRSEARAWPLVEPERDARPAWEPAAIPVPARYRFGPSGWYDPIRADLRHSAREISPTRHARVLGFLRDRVHPDIPRWYYDLVLGHDLHISVWAELYVRHFHHAPQNRGWWEDVGLVSKGKVTTAFRDFESGCLVTDQTSYGDFKFHEVGLGVTAEANTQTALVTTSGITRVSGTQTNPSAFTYQSIGTVTADTAETWTEHGLFNIVSGGTMMDRSLISPTVAVVALDTVEFTYVLTKAAEA